MLSTAQISLHIAIHAVGVVDTIHHIVHFAIAIQIHRPHIAGVEVRRLERTTATLKMDVNEDVPEVIVFHYVCPTLFLFLSVLHERHRHLGTRWQKRGLSGIVRVGKGRTIQFRSIHIHVVLCIFGFLRESAPSNCGIGTILHSHYATPHLLLQTLSRNCRGGCKCKHHKQNDGC